MTESHSNRIVSRDAKEVQFIAEQDGPPEQDFKERVVPLLRSCKSVKRAYLARVARRCVVLACRTAGGQAKAAYADRCGVRSTLLKRSTPRHHFSG